MFKNVLKSPTNLWITIPLTTGPGDPSDREVSNDVQADRKGVVWRGGWRGGLERSSAGQPATRVWSVDSELPTYPVFDV